jgi:hypothetical protein
MIRWRASVALVAVLLIGGLVGRYAGSSISVGEPVVDYHGPQGAVAQESVDLARWWLRESSPPVGPITFSMKLDQLRHVEGSCETYPAGPDTPKQQLDWEAVVSARSFYGLPIRTYRVTCAGKAVS